MFTVLVSALYRAAVSTYLFSFTPQPNSERFEFDLGSEASVTALSVDNGKI